jgi:hypothetical protein
MVQEEVFVFLRVNNCIEKIRPIIRRQNVETPTPILIGWMQPL